MPRRLILIILDGVGVGALPDAAEYGDEGSDTLGNLSRVRPLDLPILGRLGLGNVAPLEGLPPTDAPLGLPGRLACRSHGKDSTVGHWEHMGLITTTGFPTYPDGFPQEIVQAFARAIGREILGNKPASGTAIISELGEEHLATGKPIVYTSADSVFQVAAHTGVVPLEQLYEWCRIARSLLVGPHAVARVIARPFTGHPGAFVRTTDRRDFSVAPPAQTYLDLLQEAHIPVYAVGKIGEIFAGRGVSHSIKAATNGENLALVQALVEGKVGDVSFDRGLLFTNLVDFDTVWGHRNDVDGFSRGLREVDEALPGLLSALRRDDRLVLTADHGVDPTTVSTDHSREYVPLLVLPRPRRAPQAVYEGWFADTGATVFHYLTGETPPLEGTVIDDLRPSRGWRAYTPTLRLPGPPPRLRQRVAARASRKRALPAAHRFAAPVRLGNEDIARAAEWLADRWGSPPEVALVLGSGQAAAVSGLEKAPSVHFAEIPHWREGEVPGHLYRLFLVDWGGGVRVVVQAGRLHRYEGFDDSERQLMVRTLAAWGVRRLVACSASGGVANNRRAGDVVMVNRVLDFLHLLPDGNPASLDTSPFATAGSWASEAIREVEVGTGVHACMPGPHYETAAELELLRSLEVSTVSMSLADEVLAASEVGMELVALAMVVNVGDTSHGEVLEGAKRGAEGLRRTISALLGTSTG